ncbi:hypothetical protein Tco_1230907 [Tanacetum coccineum]
MSSEYQQDYKKTRDYAPKIYNDPNMTEELKDIYRALESRYVHEGRTIDPSFYRDLSDDSVAKFTNIGFDCLLSLNEKFCPRKMYSLKAKQPKKPPLKRTRNVGKSKRVELTTLSSTESPPSDNGDLPSTSPRSYGRSPTPTYVAPPPKLRFVIAIKQEPQELPPLQMSPNNPYASTMDNWPPGPSNPSPPPRVLRPPPDFPNPPPGFKPISSTQPLFVNINNNTPHLHNNTPHLHNNAPPLENIHHPPPNIRNQDFPNPPNILDFVHPNDMPHLHNMFCQCCSTTRYEI